MLRPDPLLMRAGGLENRPDLRYLSYLGKEPDVIEGWAYCLIGFVKLAERQLKVPRPIPNEFIKRFLNNVHSHERNRSSSLDIL